MELDCVWKTVTNIARDCMKCSATEEEMVCNSQGEGEDGACNSRGEDEEKVY